MFHLLFETCKHKIVLTLLDVTKSNEIHGHRD
jgi:hypothetical protein